MIVLKYTTDVVFLFLFFFLLFIKILPEVAKKTILYSAICCPFSQRVAIALKEAEIEHETVLIDLTNKPQW